MVSAMIYVRLNGMDKGAKFQDKETISGCWGYVLDDVGYEALVLITHCAQKRHFLER